MKILYFFQELPTNMYGWQRFHIIDELERHSVQVETFNPLHFKNPEEANEMVQARLKEGEYDLFFTNVCYEKTLFPETLSAIRSLGVPSLCLRCDNLVIPYNDKKLAGCFDLVWLTAKETQYLYNKWNTNSFFAPYAANPYMFAPPSKTETINRVCFIGTPYGSRSIMINCLSSSDVNIDVYYKRNEEQIDKAYDYKILSNILGPSRWKVLFNRLLFPQGRKVMAGSMLHRIKGVNSIIENDNLTSLPVVSPDKQSELYAKYTLSLASTSTNHTDVLKNPLKIVNLRNFEIPMSGGIEICKYNPELAEYFEEGKEIVFYFDNDDLIDKSKYYLERASETEIHTIKKAARKRALGEHTWWCRFTKAFDILGLQYDK